MKQPSAHLLATCVFSCVTLNWKKRSAVWHIFPVKRIILFKFLPSKYIIAKWCSLRTWLHLRDIKSNLFFKLISYTWCKKSREDSARMGMTHLRSHLRPLPLPVCDTPLQPPRCPTCQISNDLNHSSQCGHRSHCSVKMPKDKNSYARSMKVFCVLDCCNIFFNLLGEDHTNKKKKEFD